MVAHVEMNKIDIGAYGEAYEVIITDMENPEKPKFKIPISEYQFEQFKKQFDNCKKSGKFEENETYS